MQTTGAVQPYRGSPRLNRRGRIEALGPNVCDFHAKKGLHGLTAVAELKRPRCKTDGKDIRLSPRLNRRGRIEAVSFADVQRERHRLHGLTAVAELKLYYGVEAKSASYNVSTA